MKSYSKLLNCIFKLSQTNILQILPIEVLCEIFAFLNRRQLCRIEIACKCFANIMQIHFPVHPYLAIDCVQNCRLRKTTLWLYIRRRPPLRMAGLKFSFKQNVHNADAGNRSSSNHSSNCQSTSTINGPVPLLELRQYKFSIEWLLAHAMPKYLFFKLFRLTIRYPQEIFFSHPQYNAIFEHIFTAAIKPDSEIQLFYNSRHCHSRLELGAFLKRVAVLGNQKIQIGIWHLYGLNLPVDIHNPNDVPLLELSVLKLAHTIILDVRDTYDGTYMFTIEEIVGWLHVVPYVAEASTKVSPKTAKQQQHRQQQAFVETASTETAKTMTATSTMMIGEHLQKWKRIRQIQIRRTGCVNSRSRNADIEVFKAIWEKTKQMFLASTICCHPFHLEIPYGGKLSNGIAEQIDNPLTMERLTLRICTKPYYYEQHLQKFAYIERK